MKISHNMFILKLLTDLCAIRQNVRKKTLPDVVYNILVVKEFKNKETCLKINGKQTVKLRSGSIKFKNHFQRLAAPFRICPDFKCIVKKAKSSDRGDNTPYTEKYQTHIPCSLSYKLVYTDDKFRKPVVLYRGKQAVNKFIKSILEEYEYCKKVMKIHFDKNLVMSEQDEERFQSGNKCWIYDKLFDVGDNKVRYYCHKTGKYRGSAHWICNVNLN